MKLRFTPPQAQQPGTIADMLKRSYAAIVSSDPELWLPIQEEWEEFDRDIFNNPDTVGRCVFLSWSDDQLVGFGSYDSRQMPELGIVGHNCILPEFRGRGFGKQQVLEILRQFNSFEIHTARTSTLAHPFFMPAQCMYVVCGFQEIKRVPWDSDPTQDVIEYE